MESESDGEDARVQREREEAALCLTYEQRLVNPLEIRFSQPVVRPSFSDKNAVQEAVDTTHLEDGSTEFDGVLRPPFPSIRIIAWRPRLRIAGRMYMAEQQLYTLDNRRLYALQLAAMQHWPKRVGVMVGVAPRLPGQSHARKFRNPTAGVEVDVGHNFSSPDRTWCWRNVAMDVERNGFFCRIFLDSGRGHLHATDHLPRKYPLQIPSWVRSAAIVAVPGCQHRPGCGPAKSTGRWRRVHPSATCRGHGTRALLLVSTSSNGRPVGIVRLGRLCSVATLCPTSYLHVEAGSVDTACQPHGCVFSRGVSHFSGLPGFATPPG
mmetsp:Transcript_54654/g.125515  ORF Transcript_54654/g.125515 Transcript_54654/m.125515 type:complete len:322 (+) Transcript_54654:39-1004(+)